MVFLAACALALVATPVAADSVTGTILAFDRVARVIVLDDKSVWPIVPKDFPIPDDLVAGEKIRIDYVSNGDNGIGRVAAIVRVGQ